MSRYPIVVERTGNGFSAYCPALPGCVAAGDTRKEVEQLMDEAIELHLKGMRQDGEPVPVPEPVPTAKKRAAVG